MQTRNGILSALVITAFLAAPATVALAGNSPDLAFVPKKTMVVLGADFGRLRNTPLYKKLLAPALKKESKFSEGMNKLKAKGGFDWEKDLTSFSMALPKNFEKTEEFLLLVKGKFEADKLLAFAKAEGAKLKTKTHRKQTMTIIDGEGAVTFNGDYMVVGSPKVVKSSIDTKAGKAKSVEKNGDLKPLFLQVDQSKELWFAMTLPKDIQKELGQKAPPTKGVTAIGGNFGFQTGFDAKFVMICKNNKAAKSLAAFIQLAMDQAGKQDATKMLGLSSLVANANVSAKGRQVFVTSKMSQKEFKGLVKTLGAMAGAG